VAWPNPNQYAEAIQNSKLAFSDGELQRGAVVLNQYKLPRPISGNFATVFEIVGPGKKWAVRCFLREVTNHQQRYSAITRHLQSHPLDFMVGFEYLPEGIRVAGKWYPILKMDWTRGVQLDRYIEEHLNEPAKLDALANQWVTMCRQLRQADLAHGDLQHGNILITDQNQFKLIDYDGVTIPSTIGFTQNEIGHRHYQHPSRTSDQSISASNFRNVDNFPAHVIGLSLYALSIDPSLWSKTDAGVENLLFRDVDYKDPTNSKTLNLLRNHADSRIRAIARRMTDVITMRSYLDVPPLERLEPALGSTIGRWIADHLPQPNNSVQASSAVTNSSVEPNVPEWLRDHFEVQAASQFEFPDDFILSERQTIEREFQNSLLRWFRPLFRQFASARVHDRFATYPLAKDKVRIEERLQLLRREQAKLQMRISAIPQTVDDVRLSAFAEVQAAEQAAQKVNKEINNSWRLEREELERLAKYVAESLQKHKISPNSVSGIGKARIAALNSAGVFTAGDITPANRSRALAALENIRGANPDAEWQKLEGWFDEQRNTLKPPPSTVARSESATAISAAYNTTRRNMQSKLEDLQREVIRVRNAVLKNEQARLRTLSNEVATVERQIRETQRILQRYVKITLEILIDKIVNSSAGI